MPGFLALWALAASAAPPSRKKIFLHALLLASYLLIATLSLHNHYFDPRHAKQAYEATHDESPDAGD